MKTAKNPLWVLVLTSLCLAALLSLAVNSPLANSATERCPSNNCDARTVSLQDIIP